MNNRSKREVPRQTGRFVPPFRKFFFATALLLASLVMCVPSLVFALTNNLALTPPMGWNDWNSYACNINEGDVTNTAGVMVANGMKAAGYQYVNIDDGWASTRDATGIIQAYSIPTKFPHGIQWLADNVHAKGLKLGIYTDHGTLFCSSCVSGQTPPQGPGSLGHEYADAFTFASWGVDYLKNDSCNLPGGDNAQADYFRMEDGLMKAGRPIFVSICQHAEDYDYWAPAEGNSWRTINDITTAFSRILFAIDQDTKSAYLAGPGQWNDPDDMEVGNGLFKSNLTAAQTHFTMWCIMAAPLIAGNNLTSMSSGILGILTNPEAIAVDQDPAGEQGVRVGGVVDSAEVWSKPLGYDFTTRAVALLNRSTNSSATITCYWTNLQFEPGMTATVRDLVSHTDLGTFTGSFSATVPAYGSRLLKIVGTPMPPPSPGTNYLSSLHPIYSYVNSNNVWLTVQKNQSIAGTPIKLNGVTYANGLGVSAMSGIEYNLGGVCTRFQSTIGVDDAVGSSGSVIFQVYADGRKIFDSGILTGSSAQQSIDLDVTGVRRLTLGVSDTGNNVSPGFNSRDNNDAADWANALVITANTVQVPHAPTGLKATPGNAIALNWNTTTAAITYNVKRATSSGGPYTTIANVPFATYSDSNVSSGTTYYYVVSAVSSLGESANSAQIGAAPCFVPAAPTGVTASSGSSAVFVQWNGSSGATSYNVYRFTGVTPPAQIASGITGTSYSDASVSSGTTNYYYVTAVGACTESGWANFAGVVVTSGGGNLSGTYQIENVASSLSLNVSNAITTNGAAIIQYVYGGSNNEKWTFKATDSGYYQMVNVNSGLDAVVQGASVANGALIVQWSFGSSGDDQWLPQQNSDGTYTFFNRKSGLVLEDPGSSLAAKTQMDQWSSTGASNQKWNLISH